MSGWAVVGLVVGAVVVAVAAVVVALVVALPRMLDEVDWMNSQDY